MVPFHRLLASGGHGTAPSDFWAAWPSDPILQVALAGAICLYAVGYTRLRRRSAQAIPTWWAWCYAGGVAAIAVALLSPVAVYSDRLFFVHMVQHLLLLLIAPPLLWLGAPLLPSLWGLPDAARRRLGRLLAPGRSLARLGHALTLPWIAATAFVVTVAVWHIPQFYDAAQGRTLPHDLQHLMFFGTALLYWWPVVHPTGGRRRLSYARAIPYLLPPFLEGMLIGVLLTFADQPLYRHYADMESTWGFSTMDDQQLGGLIMWVPGGMLFLIPLIGLLTMLLRSEDRNARGTAARSRPGRAGA